MDITAPKNIAKDFKIGNTHVRIATDYCNDKTSEEVQKILDRIAISAIQHFTAAQMAKMNE